MDIDDLGVEVEKQRIERNNKLRHRYRLARSLGFSSNESRVLMSKTETLIKKLAEDKKNGKT